MNVRLLKQRDEQECLESYDELWTIALTASGRRLFIPPFATQDREEIAQQVLFEFLGMPPPAGIDRCDDDDDETCRRWIRQRSRSRATDLLRRRRRENAVINREQNHEGNNFGEDGIAVSEPVPLNLETLVDELVAVARLRRGGFSILEEAIFREILIEDTLQREFAQQYCLPLGTVGRLVTQVREKLSRIIGGELDLF